MKAPNHHLQFAEQVSQGKSQSFPSTYKKSLPLWSSYFVKCVLNISKVYMMDIGWRRVAPESDGYPGTCRRRAMEEEILWDPANL